MKVLLIGGTGNIGSRLIPALVSHHHKVVAYVRDALKLSLEAQEYLDKGSPDSVILGNATDESALKAAILTHDCDAVVNCAGWAAMTGLQSQGDFPAIFQAVLKAVISAGKERGGQPIRVWFMSSFFTLDAPIKPYLIGDYIPLFPSHRPNYQLIKDIPTSSAAWSLFCPNRPLPRYKEAKFPSQEDCSASNLIAGPDSPPDWQDWYTDVPYVGSWLNVILQARSYYVKMEDCVDFIAADLEQGLHSEWIGRRVSVKEKEKAL